MKYVTPIQIDIFEKLAEKKGAEIVNEIEALYKENIELKKLNHKLITVFRHFYGRLRIINNNASIAIDSVEDFINELPSYDENEIK